MVYLENISVITNTFSKPDVDFSRSVKSTAKMSHGRFSCKVIHPGFHLGKLLLCCETSRTIFTPFCNILIHGWLIILAAYQCTFTLLSLMTRSIMKLLQNQSLETFWNDKLSNFFSIVKIFPEQNAVH